MSETIGDGARKRRGNPRTGAGSRGGKGHALTVRITAETRQWLDDEVKASGRSLGQVVEMNLERAKLGAEGVEAQLGGLQVADAIRAMVQHARDVAAHPELGDPTASILARDALLAGWRTIIGKAVPYTPASLAEAELARLRSEIRIAAGRLLEALDAAPESAGAKAANANYGVNALSPNYTPDARPLRAVLADVANGSPLASRLVLELSRGLQRFLGKVKGDEQVLDLCGGVIGPLEPYTEKWAAYTEARAAASDLGRDIAQQGERVDELRAETAEPG